MANTDRPFGMKLLSAYRPQFMHYYPVVTAYATSVFRGDLIGNLATPTSYVCAALGGDTRPGVRPLVAGAAGEIVGVVMGTYDENLLPLVYYVASSAGDGVIGGYLLINTDPDALYLIQEDGDTTPIASGNIGKNCDLITTHAGNTVTGVSKMELDSSSVAETATLAVKIIRAWPGDTVAAAYCRHVVKLNAAVMGTNVVTMA